MVWHPIRPEALCWIDHQGKGLKPLRLSTAHKASTLTRRSWFISLATPDTNLCTVVEGEDTLVLVPVGSSCGRNSFRSFPDQLLAKECLSCLQNSRDFWQKVLRTEIPKSFLIVCVCSMIACSTKGNAVAYFSFTKSLISIDAPVNIWSYLWPKFPEKSLILAVLCNFNSSGIMSSLWQVCKKLRWRW